jgi:hypothetical protein
MIFQASQDTLDGAALGAPLTVSGKRDLRQRGTSAIPVVSSHEKVTSGRLLHIGTLA